MRSRKGSRRIVVNDVEYRWRANGDDGYISIGIWPANDTGPYISGNLKYDESWTDAGYGARDSARDQIVVTNRIIRRVIEYAIALHGYNPNVKGAVLLLRVLDHVIQWQDAVRATDSRTRPS